MHVDYSVTISLQEERKIKIFNALKLKKAFHKYLSTYMLHSKLSKERG